MGIRLKLNEIISRLYNFNACNPATTMTKMTLANSKSITFREGGGGGVDCVGMGSHARLVFELIRSMSCDLVLGLQFARLCAPPFFRVRMVMIDDHSGRRFHGFPAVGCAHNRIPAYPVTCS